MSDFAERYVTLADPLAAYDEVVAAVGDLVGRTRIDQFALPSPCQGWTVHKILDHLVERTHRERNTGSGDLDGHPHTPTTRRSPMRGIRTTAQFRL